jgi:hypothetical protein
MELLVGALIAVAGLGILGVTVWIGDSSLAARLRQRPPWDNCIVFMS